MSLHEPFLEKQCFHRCADSACSDQPAQLCSIMRACAVRFLVMRRVKVVPRQALPPLIRLRMRRGKKNLGFLMAQLVVSKPSISSG